MGETLRLLQTTETVHGLPGHEAAARLQSAIELIARHAAENAEHPELAKERYTMESTRC